MKKLYVATVELMLYVMAESEEDAMIEAKMNIRDELDNIDPSDFDARRALGSYDANWKDAYPYNADDDRTVQDIFEAEKQLDLNKKARIENEKKQLKLFQPRDRKKGGDDGHQSI